MPRLKLRPNSSTPKELTSSSPMRPIPTLKVMGMLFKLTKKNPSRTLPVTLRWIKLWRRRPKRPLSFSHSFFFFTCKFLAFDLLRDYIHFFCWLKCLFVGFYSLSLFICRLYLFVHMLHYVSKFWDMFLLVNLRNYLFENLIYLSTYLLMDFTILTRLGGGGVHLWVWHFLINPLGWSCPLMDIMIFWSSFGMNPSILWIYNFNSSLGMSPSTYGLNNLNSSFGMNLSTCGLLILTYYLGWTRPLKGFIILDHPLGWICPFMDLIILTYPVGWTCPLMDFIISYHPLGWTHPLMGFIVLTHPVGWTRPFMDNNFRSPLRMNPSI